MIDRYNLDGLIIDYSPNEEDDDRIREIKERIMRLPLPKKKIMLIWIESGSFSKTAKVLGVSVPTVSKYVKMTLKEIGYDYRDTDDSNDNESGSQ